MTHIIDCSKDPFVPEDWTVIEHINRDKFTWRKNLINFFYHQRQCQPGYAGYRYMDRSLSSLQVFNANLLDFLLENTDLIPLGWDRLRVFFWGTKYSDKVYDHNIFIRCLMYDVNGWTWFYEECDGYEWGANTPIAILNK